MGIHGNNSPASASIRSSMAHLTGNPAYDVYTAILNQADIDEVSEDVLSLRKQIKDCDQMIQKYENGHKFIEDHTVAFLNV